MAMPSFLSNPLGGLDVESLILNGLEAIPDIVAGPLTGNLYGYDFTSLKYPDDIEHYFMHGHYINFFINVQRASKYYDEESLVYSYPAGVNGNGGLFGDLFGDSGFYQATDDGYFGEDLSNVGESAQSAVSKLTTQRITQAVSLYIPDSMSFNTNIAWDQTSLTGKGTELLTSLARSVSDKMQFGGVLKALANAGEYVGRAAGFAVNPEILVLYRGIDLRTFQYDFFFAPKSEREATSIQNIIRAFRFHAAPEVNSGFGLFYVAPSTFDIEFMHRGKRNNCIHQVKTCVLTGYSVDYAPSGWSTHIDGMPIQTRLSLTFQETELLTKEHIAQGF